MHAVFRADASPLMGGGHVMRCLALAAGLAKEGARVSFASAELPQWLRDRIAAAAFELILLPPLPSSRDGHDGERVWPEGAQRSDAEAVLRDARPGPSDWLVVDHYALNAPWDQQVRAAGAKLLVIDDLANRRHDNDMLIDHTLGRSARDYEALVPASCRILTGAGYALLRSEFVLARPSALARRREGGPVRRILVSLGTTDVGGITERVLRALLDADIPGTIDPCTIDVVMGAEGLSLPALLKLAQAEPRVKLHIDISDMAALASAADVAVGAAGTSSWERCCLGLPSVTLILAENQRLVAEELAKAGAAIIVAGQREAAASVLALIEDRDRRERMIAAAAAVTDGEGVQRVVREMAGAGAPASAPEITLRAADEGHAEAVWLWRNEPLARAMSENTAPIAWRDHIAWYGKMLASPQSEMRIAERNNEPVGLVRYDRVPETNDYEVSINIRPSLRGSGIGKLVLESGCAERLLRQPDARLMARISDANPASRRIFEQVGFQLVERIGDNGFALYALAAEGAQ